MEPALLELYAEGAPGDEVAVIIRLADPFQAPRGVRIITQQGDIATCRLPRGEIPAIRGHVSSMKAPRLYSPTPSLEETEDDEAESDPSPGPSDERRPQAGLPTGEGVVVAHIDWGLDVCHPDFRHPDGRTRILALWDQGCAADPLRPNRYGYGVIHDAGAIDRALLTADPYGTLGYHPAASDAGQGSHGSHTMGISAGNGRSGGPVGMAPGASIVFVHLSTATAEGQALLGDSVAFLEALDFIAQVAGERPLVINASIGRQCGEHDGKTLTERGMDAFLLAAPGRAIVQSTGNYFDRAAHATGVLRPGQERTLRLEVAEGGMLPTEVDIWYPGVDRLGLRLRGPPGVSEVTATPDVRVLVMADGREVGRLYQRIGDPNNGDNEITLFLSPSAPAGQWEITLSGADVADGRFHAWVERTAAAARHRSRFHPDDVDTTTTLGTICNGLRTLAVGAYDAHQAERPLARFSSCGPTREGRWKPDLVAPGVRVLSARSHPRAIDGDAPLQVRMSGSSMSSPHAAGCVAVMFAAAGRPLAIDETRRLLLATADPPPADADLIERLRLGSGYLNMAAAVEAARQAGGRDRPRAETQPDDATPEAVAVEAVDREPTAMEGEMSGSAEQVESEMSGSPEQVPAEAVPAMTESIPAEGAADVGGAVELADSSGVETVSVIAGEAEQAAENAFGADAAEADPFARVTWERDPEDELAEQEGGESYAGEDVGKARPPSGSPTHQPGPELPFQFQIPLTGGPASASLPAGCR